MLEYLLTDYVCLCITAPDFVTSDKENKKKLTLAFLEKAKEICSSRGVSQRNSFFYSFSQVLDSF